MTHSSRKKQRTESEAPVVEEATSPCTYRPSTQQYGIPTYDSLFKYVLDDPNLLPSLIHALAGLDVASATRIDDHMNPLQELEHLRALIHDDKTSKAFSSLYSKENIDVSYQGGKNKHVHKNFTKFIKALLPHFEDLKRAFPKRLYDGTMDLVCRLSNGEIAMVEIQVIPAKGWDKRALGYIAAFYGNQMRQGEDWKDIKRVIGINILGGGKDGLEHWKDSPAEYKRHYKMQEQTQQIPARYIDGIEIYQYSLMHAPSLPGAVGVDKERQDWLTFFKNASRMTEEDVKKQISTPAVLEAFMRAKLDILPLHVRELYADQESQYENYSMHTLERFDAGKAEGIEEGVKQGIEEGVKQGIEEGVKQGIEEGVKQGEAAAFKSLIDKLKKTGKSDKKIKKRLLLSDEDFKNYTQTHAWITFGWVQWLYNTYAIWKKIYHLLIR